MEDGTTIEESAIKAEAMRRLIDLFDHEAVVHECTDQKR